MSPVTSVIAVFNASGGAVWLGFLASAGLVIFEYLLADIQKAGHGLDNTRAVPLVRKEDAHKGRVSFLPKFEASREGVTA